jgi:hypothetical protein
MFAYDFGKRKNPCGDCWDGRCTMNCGPAVMTDLDTIVFGKRRAKIVGASWDKTAQRAFIVYTDENGGEHTTRAMGMSRQELRQAVLDELTHEKWGRR